MTDEQMVADLREWADSGDPGLAPASAKIIKAVADRLERLSRDRAALLEAAKHQLQYFLDIGECVVCDKTEGPLECDPGCVGRMMRDAIRAAEKADQ